MTESRESEKRELNARFRYVSKLGLIGLAALATSACVVLVVSSVIAAKCLTAAIKDAEAECAAAAQHQFLFPGTRTNLKKRLAAAQLDSGKNAEAKATLTAVIEAGSAGFHGFSNRAAASYRLGQIDDAVQDYKKAYQLRSDDETALQNLVDTLIESADYEDAIETAAAYLLRNPESLPGHIMLAWANYRAGKYPRAQSVSQAAIEKDGKNAEVYNILALALEKTGDQDRALLNYGKAIAADSGSARYLINRAMLYHDLGKYKEAEDDYRKALGINHSPEALVGLALTLMETGKYENTNRLLDEAIALDPKYHAAHSALARFYINKGDKAAARKAATEALRLAPENPNATYWLSSVEYEEGNFEAALKGYRSVVYIWPKSPVLQNDIGHTLVELGRFDEAVAAFSKAIEFAPEEPGGHEGRARAYIGLENWKAAIADASKAIAISPSGGIAYTRRAYAEWSLEQIEAARKDYDRSLELLPDLAWLHEERADFLLYAGEQAEAKRAIDGLLRSDAPSAYAYRLRGRLAEMEGRYGAAIEDYNKSMELSPDNKWLIEDRAWAYLANDQPLEALADCEKMIAELPKEPAAFRCRAKTRQRMLEDEMALEDLNTALKLDPDYSPALFDKAYIELSLFRNDKAIEDFTALIKKKHRLAESHYFRGLAHEYENDTGLAARDYERALSLATDRFAVDVSVRLNSMRAKMPASALPELELRPQSRFRGRGNSVN